MINFLKNLAILGIVISGLTALGLVINSIPIWGYVTNIFVFIRMLIRPAQVIWDVPSLLEVVGWFFKLLTGGASFFAIYMAYKMFRK
jgi:hypothetical protein